MSDLHQKLPSHQIDLADASLVGNDAADLEQEPSPVGSPSSIVVVRSVSSTYGCANHFVSEEDESMAADCLTIA